MNKPLLIVAVILVFELSFVSVLFSMLGDAEHQLTAEQHARDVISRLTKISGLIQTATMDCVRATMPGGETNFSEPQKDLNNMLQELNDLKATLKDRGSELDAINRLGVTCESAIPVLADARDAFVAHQPAGYWMKLLVLKGKSDSTISQIDSIVSGYEQMEREAIAGHSRAQQQLITALLIGIGLHIAAVITLAILYTRNIASRLQRLGRNTALLSMGQPLLPAMGGKDDIASVDAAFHKMASMLQDAQKRERAIVENAVDVIFSLDKDLQFGSINAACETSWGFAPDDLIGKRSLTLIPEDHKEEVRGKLTQALGAPGTAASFETPLVCVSGTVVQTLWSIQSSPTDLFCVVHDITERKRAEMFKQELYTMISHDIRAPLMAAECSLAMLSEGACGKLESKATENVSDAERNVGYVMALVNDLLEVERIGSGKTALRFKDTNATDLLARARDTVAPLAKEKDVTIEVSKGDVPFVGDEERMLQVLINLLGNGIRYAPSGSAVKAECSTDGGEVEFKITDEGPGVPAAEQSRIFLRFERGEEAGQEKGSGLGLAISKNIVELHGGSIGVRSADGKGSTFWIRLPKKPAQ